jgi:hypothetical protein
MLISRRIRIVGRRAIMLGRYLAIYSEGLKAEPFSHPTVLAISSPFGKTISYIVA